MNSHASFHQKLKQLMDDYAHKAYNCTMSFPKEEVFGLSSQLRRSALSVVLNYIEGYARQGKKILKHFLEISYGSLKESQYLIEFSYARGHVSEKNLKELKNISDQIGAMLWSTIKKLKE